MTFGPEPAGTLMMSRRGHCTSKPPSGGPTPFSAASNPCPVRAPVEGFGDAATGAGAVRLSIRLASRGRNVCGSALSAERASPSLAGPSPAASHRPRRGRRSRPAERPLLRLLGNAGRDARRRPDFARQWRRHPGVAQVPAQEASRRGEQPVDFRLRGSGVSAIGVTRRNVRHACNDLIRSAIR